MKILQIMLSTYYGGSERYFVDLCNELAVTQEEIVIVCDKRFKLLNELETKDNAEIIPIKIRGHYDVIGAITIWSILKQKKPDIVHTHLGRASRLAAPVARLLGIPTITTAHTYFKYKHYRYIDHVIATTRALKSHCIGLGFNEANVAIIPALSRYAPIHESQIKASADKEGLCWLAYGRHVYSKGFDVLIDAFYELLDARPNDRLIIGGEGPEHASLLEQVQRLNMQDKVLLPGWLKDVASSLANADVFVLPSRQEAFGLVVLESMAHGVPIISSAAHGPIEYLDKNISMLFDPGNKSDLLKCMLTLANNPGLRERTAKNALRMYEHYRASNVVPKIISTYKEVLTARDH